MRYSGHFLTAFTFLVVRLALSQPTLADASNPPSLDAGDEVQISVLGEADFTGKYTVDATGALALPWAGRIEVAGHSLPEVEQALVAKLRASFLENPHLTVSVVEYRPIYVQGDVRSAGRYPFRIGMSALQAVALAGGFRSSDTDESRLRQDLTRARERFQVVNLDLAGALIREARLVAERDNADDIGAPGELQNTDDTRLRIEAERRIFHSRRQALAGEIDMLRQQQRGYNEELNALNGQMEAKNKQAALVQIELNDTTSLVNRGLQRKPEMLMLQRMIAGLDADKLQLVALIARSKEDIAKTELSITSRRNDRLTEVLTQLQDTQGTIRKLRAERESAASLVAQNTALLGTPSMTLSLSGAASRPHELAIIRRQGKQVVTTPAGDDEPILPGDMLIVTVPTTSIETPTASLRVSQSDPVLQPLPTQ